jgi:hypothetical protein
MPEQPRDPAKEMQQRYKNVFGTMEGRRVLGDILTLGHFGEILNPQEDVRLGEHNLAIAIARMAGAFDQVYQFYGMTEKGE